MKLRVSVDMVGEKWFFTAYFWLAFETEFLYKLVN